MNMSVENFLDIKKKSGTLFENATSVILKDYMEEIEALRQAEHYIFLPRKADTVSDIKAMPNEMFVLIDLDRCKVIGEYYCRFCEPQEVPENSKLSIIQSKTFLPADIGPIESKDKIVPLVEKKVKAKKAAIQDDSLGNQSLESESESFPIMSNPRNEFIIDELGPESTLFQASQFLTKRCVNALCDTFSKGMRTPLSQIAKLHPQNLREISQFGLGSLNSLAGLFEKLNIPFAKEYLKSNQVKLITTFTD